MKVIFFFFLLFISSCEFSNNNEFSKADNMLSNQYFSLMDKLPSGYLSYMSEKDKDGRVKATVAFGSRDIGEYIGPDFSVKIFIINHLVDSGKNDAAQRLFESFSKNSSLEKFDEEVIVATSGEDAKGREDVLLISTYRSKSSRGFDMRFIEQDGQPLVAAKEIFTLDEKARLNGVYEYTTSYKNLAMLYQIKYSSGKISPDEMYVYARNHFQSFIN